MKMERALTVALLAAAACAAGGQDIVGGYVEGPKDGKFLRLVAASRRVKLMDAMFMSEQMRQAAHLPAVLEPGESGDGMKEIGLWGGNPRTGCVIAFADGESSGEIVSVCEKGVSAIVNMARLSVDGPDDGILSSRMRKAAWIAVGELLGRPVFKAGSMSVEALDGIVDEVPPFEETCALTRLAVARGMTPRGRFSYRTACMQGWAPAPTCDVQRTLWERAKDPTARWKQDFGDKAR